MDEDKDLKKIGPQVQQLDASKVLTDQRNDALAGGMQLLTNSDVLSSNQIHGQWI